VEEAGGVGGGGLFVVFSEPDGDGGLVEHALLDIWDVGGGGEDFAEEAGDFGLGCSFGVGKIHFLGNGGGGGAGLGGSASGGSATGGPRRAMASPARAAL